MAYTTSSTPIPTRDRKKREQDDELPLPIEDLTVSYMRGEIDLRSYRDKLRAINARLDLRKIAHKLWKPKSTE